MSADHVDPSTKVHCLSDYKWWSCNGDVDAMRTEADKCQWTCICCHFLEPTSSTGRQRCSTRPSDDIREKRVYVDARTVKIGPCQYDDCGRVVTQKAVRTFSFDHIDPSTKATHETHPHLIHKKHQGGVFSIAINRYTSLENIRDELDAEMDKCKLLCENCHKSRKPRKRGRWDAS